MAIFFFRSVNLSLRVEMEELKITFPFDFKANTPFSGKSSHYTLNMSTSTPNSSTLERKISFCLIILNFLGYTIKRSKRNFCLLFLEDSGFSNNWSIPFLNSSPFLLKNSFPEFMRQPKFLELQRIRLLSLNFK